MKASSLVVLALTILNSIECSGSGNKSIKRIGKYSEKGSKTSSTSSAVAESPQPKAVKEAPVLSLVETTAIGANKITASSKPFESDLESLKSISDNEEPAKKAEDSNKRKRSDSPLSADGGNGSEIEFDEEMVTGAAVDALLSLSNISTADFGSNKNGKKKKSKVIPKAKKAPKAPRKLLDMSDELFAKATAKNFNLYFDESNINAVGPELLSRCFTSSHYFGLAKYLILNGIRMPSDNEVILSCLLAINNVYDETTLVSQKILGEYLRVDPMEAVRLFVAAASRMEAGEENVDLLMFGLLTNNEDLGAMFLTNPEIVQFIRMLMETGRMSTTLNHILSQEEIPATVLNYALQQKVPVLISGLLQGGFYKVDEMVTVGGVKYSFICHLFGKFSFVFISNLIDTYNYPLTFSHDPANNPRGDIIIAVVIARDLDAFKGLLRRGASYDCKIRTKNASQASLESFLSIKTSYADFYDALIAFKSETQPTA